MSLNDDLKRNRKIFEQLTNIAETETAIAPSPRAEPVPPPINETVREPFEAPDTVRQKYRSFSLNNGESFVPRETTAVSSFEAPAGVSYPALSRTNAEARPSDPLEGLYFQLEAEARRSSQLSCEEDY